MVTAMGAGQDSASPTEATSEGRAAAVGHFLFLLGTRGERGAFVSPEGLVLLAPCGVPEHTSYAGPNPRIPGMGTSWGNNVGLGIFQYTHL